MSRAVLNAILNQMQIWLNETEKEQLHRELFAHFGLIGATKPMPSLRPSLERPIQPP